MCDQPTESDGRNTSAAMSMMHMPVKRWTTVAQSTSRTLAS